MASDQDLLDLVETEIESRLSGGAIESAGQGSMNFRKASLWDLYRLREMLISRIAGGQGGVNQIEWGDPA